MIHSIISVSPIEHILKCRNCGKELVLILHISCGYFHMSYHPRSFKDSILYFFNMLPRPKKEELNKNTSDSQEKDDAKCRYLRSFKFHEMLECLYCGKRGTLDIIESKRI